MASWDIFHSDRLEAERNLSTEEVRQRFASGQITEDDLGRPSGSRDPWTRLGDLPAFSAPVAEPAPSSEPPPQVSSSPPKPVEKQPEPLTQLPGSHWDTIEAPSTDSPAPGPFETIDQPTVVPARDPIGPKPAPPEPPKSPAPDSVEPVEIPYAEIDADSKFNSEPFELRSVEELEEDTHSISLAPPDSPDEAEDLDLTAMVDVAFQLVLFFLVTATTVHFKTLEIPIPEPDENEAVAQQIVPLDELLDDYILVEIAADGSVQIDSQPLEGTSLVSRLQQVRQETERNRMLLMADFTTPHRNTVSAIDAAKQLDMAEIAIARPSDPGS